MDEYELIPLSKLAADEEIPLSDWCKAAINDQIDLLVSPDGYDVFVFNSSFINTNMSHLDYVVHAAPVHVPDVRALVLSHQSCDSLARLEMTNARYFIGGIVKDDHGGLVKARTLTTNYLIKACDEEEGSYIRTGLVRYEPGQSLLKLRKLTRYSLPFNELHGPIQNQQRIDVPGRPVPRWELHRKQPGIPMEHQFESAVRHQYVLGLYSSIGKGRKAISLETGIKVSALLKNISPRNVFVEKRDVSKFLEEYRGGGVKREETNGASDIARAQIYNDLIFSATSKDDANKFCKDVLGEPLPNQFTDSNIFAFIQVGIYSWHKEHFKKTPSANRIKVYLDEVGISQSDSNLLTVFIRCMHSKNVRGKEKILPQAREVKREDSSQTQKPWELTSMRLLLRAWEKFYFDTSRLEVKAEEVIEWFASKGVKDKAADAARRLISS